MEDAPIVLKRLIIWPLVKTMAYVNEHPKIKSWCLYRLSNFPILTEKLLRLHRNYTVISKIESDLNEIESFFSKSGAALPDMDLSNLSPEALRIYKELKASMVHRLRK